MKIQPQVVAAALLLLSGALLPRSRADPSPCAGAPPTLPAGCGCPGSDPHMLECHCPMNVSKKMTSLPAAASLPSEVTTIIFLNCRFTHIDYVPYKQVENLHIRNSGVMSIKDAAFGDLKNLAILDLSLNELRNLTKDMFWGLSMLKILVAPGNRLTQLGSNAFEYLPHLEKIELSQNSGLQLPDNIFESNPKLKTVELRKCGLNALPNAVTGLTTLVELDVDLNSLKILGRHALSRLTNLKTLGMDSCALDHIDDDAFHGLTQLDSLNLGNNHLMHAPARLFHDFRSTLRYLYLESNHLQTLSEDVLNWDQVQRVHLDHNPWVCDCALQWMGTTLEGKHDKENVTCRAPHPVKGQSVFNVTRQMTCSTSATSNVALAIIIPIIIICCVLIGYFLYKIVRNRRRTQHKTVRYSAVYKDTVESAKYRPDVI